MYNKNVAGSFCFILICVIMQLTVFSYIIFYYIVPSSTLRLDKVVILSRHNVRTPLSKNLQKMSPYEWPKWEEGPGILTKKGFRLEEYLGKYFYDWLNKEGMLPKVCPSENDLYVYSSYTQRTLYSALAFVSTSFPRCTITIHHSDDSKPEPIFSNYVHNSTLAFHNTALKEMSSLLNHLNLNSSYHVLEDVLNYKNSEFCTVEGKCDLSGDFNDITVAAGKKPKVTGPLKISNEAVDTFLMEYYNGFEAKNVAWGKLRTVKQWSSILGLSEAYHNVAYGTNLIASDLAQPLINFVKKSFTKDRKITLLMGHDVNIIVLLKAMLFKPYNLKHSFVPTPIGGKIVFQKWFDKRNDRYLLKINYIYQSNQQIRDEVVLSLNNPPQISLLELENCPIDKEGFCLWDDFENFLKDL